MLLLGHGNNPPYISSKHSESLSENSIDMLSVLPAHGIMIQARLSLKQIDLPFVR